MALSHKKLLKKQLKKQKKQKTKQSSVTPKAFYELPVFAAWETEFIQGIVSVCFARRITASEYHLSMYLLDTWALGVKDAYMRRCSYEEYDNNIESSHRYNRAEPGRLKQLILDTVSFGSENGFTPAGDYQKMLPFLNRVSTEGSESHDISFGDNGKVVYIANPEIETTKEIKERLVTLTETLGSEEFHFIAPQEIISPEATVGDSSRVLFREGKEVKIDELTSGDINNKRILKTLTNEPHMMVRLYYNITDFNLLIKALDKIDCVEYTDDSTFHFIYDDEAKNFGLDVPYNKVPKKAFPIILAHGHFFNKNTLLKLDLRSYRRAISIIKFIDTHIDRDALILDEIASYNELMYDPNVTFEQVFKDVEENPQESFSGFWSKIENDETLTKKEKSAKAIQYANSIAEKVKPVVTKYPTNYYEDGIESIEHHFTIQEILAHKHATGFPNYTLKNLLNEKINPE